MKPTRKLLLSALTLTIFLGYARPCSFPDDELIFVQRYGPDAPYDAFTKGRLGVILPTYRVRNLVVAYRYLTGTPLTPDEQKAAKSSPDELDPHYTPENPYVENPPPQSASPAGSPSPTPPHPPPARSPARTTKTSPTASTTPSTPPPTPSTTPQIHGPNNLEVTNWLAAQNTVFTNCTQASKTANLPEPAPANASLWLKQDRAYQIAAANFYALNYDAAITEFREIADDKASPWHTIAPYLVARAMLRRAFCPTSSATAPLFPK